MLVPVCDYAEVKNKHTYCMYLQSHHVVYVYLTEKMDISHAQYKGTK
jgi:hypothetical protein